MITRLFFTHTLFSKISPFGRLFPVCLAVFIAADDQTVIATIFPSIMRDLHINISDIDKAAWTITGYLLGYICMMPVAGKLSDIFGHKRLLIILLIAEFLISNYHTLITYEIINYSGCQSAEIPSDINQLKEALIR